MQKCVSMKNRTKTLRICKTLSFFSMIIFVGSLFFQMYIANSTALKGKDFMELYDKKQVLEKEIAYLEFEDSNLSSLSNIETKAEKLGFVEMTEPLLPIKSPALAVLSTQ